MVGVDRLARSSVCVKQSFEADVEDGHTKRFTLLIKEVAREFGLLTLVE
jgi:hypothetical protein